MRMISAAKEKPSPFDVGLQSEKTTYQQRTRHGGSYAAKNNQHLITLQPALDYPAIST